MDLNNDNLNNVNSPDLNNFVQENPEPIKEYNNYNNGNNNGIDSNKGTKKNNVFLIVLVVIIVLLLMTIIGYFALIKITQNKVTSYLTTFLDNLKVGEMSYDEFSDDIDLSSLNKDDSNNKEFVKVYCKDLKYEILDVSGDLKNVKIDCKITNKDSAEILNKMFTEIFKYSMNNINLNMTDEDYEKLILDFLQNDFNTDGIKEVTNEITVYYEYVDGKWKANSESSSDLVNAVFPGLSDMLDEMKGLF